jgi:hypothetical protein
MTRWTVGPKYAGARPSIRDRTYWQREKSAIMGHAFIPESDYRNLAREERYGEHVALVDPPYEFIADGLLAGEVVPFFGAAASAIYRPDEPWEPGSPFMPFGGELANTLARAAKYPLAEKPYKETLADLEHALTGLSWRCDDDRQLILSEISRLSNDPADTIAGERVQSVLAPLLRRLDVAPDLALVASWAEHVQGHRRAVERKLREAFDVECSPGILQTKLAAIEATCLYVTTNYDDLVEKALASRKPHVIVDRGSKGLQVFAAGNNAPIISLGHDSPKPIRRRARTSRSEAQEISPAASPVGDDLYKLLNDPQTGQPSHPILFKMHGNVDKNDPRNDCYLITEEDYVDFLGRSAGSYVPPYIGRLMEGKDFLFLGYSLEDWNVRVILRKLLSRSPSGSVKFWAIVNGHSEAEQQVWQSQHLNIYPMDLRIFANELAAELDRRIGKRSANRQ